MCLIEFIDIESIQGFFDVVVGDEKSKKKVEENENINFQACEKKSRKDVYVRSVYA